MIVSSGAIGSPHLLQMSGIGPAEIVRKLGVASLVDLPGIPCVSLSFASLSLLW